MSQHQQHQVPPMSHYIGVFLALMVLTLVTVGAAKLDLGILNTPIALTIAGTKAFLVMYIFMELRSASPLTRLSALSGVVFLAIMLIMIGQDYVARSYMPPPANWGKTLSIIEQGSPMTAPSAPAPAHAAPSH